MSPQFQQLATRLKKRLQQPLPGGAAHESFRARPVGDVKPLFDHKLPPKPGSVLILLFEENGVVKFPLTKRAEYPGAHSGQISLPGGKSEPGEDVIQTALRECEEEIGVDRGSVTVLGKLSEFFVMPSNFMVTPVIAIAPDPPVFKPDAREVVKILEQDLGSFLLPGAVKEQEILVTGKFRMMAPHFLVQGEIVWGATAMMLNEFRIILQEINESSSGNP